MTSTSSIPSCFSSFSSPSVNFLPILPLPIYLTALAPLPLSACLHLSPFPLLSASSYVSSCIYFTLPPPLSSSCLLLLFPFLFLFIFLFLSSCFLSTYRPIPTSLPFSISPLFPPSFLLSTYLCNRLSGL
jgi:hypothetical protein